MSGIADLLEKAQDSDVEVFLDDTGTPKVRYPPDRREQLTPILNALRARRDEVTQLLRECSGVSAPAECPSLPRGVRLVKYQPKTPPVAIRPCSIVTDMSKFLHAYLRDLAWRLAHPNSYACGPLPEILAKLAEVGVELEIENG